jgi:hypothetical protein
VMDIGYWVLGTGYWVLGIGYWILVIIGLEPEFWINNKNIFSLSALLRREMTFELLKEKIIQVSAPWKEILLLKSWVNQQKMECNDIEEP